MKANQFRFYISLPQVNEMKSQLLTIMTMNNLLLKCIELISNVNSEKPNNCLWFLSPNKPNALPADEQTWSLTISRDSNNNKFWEKNTKKK